MGRIVVLIALETAILIAAVIAFAVGAQLGGMGLLALAMVTPLVSWATSRSGPPQTHARDLRTIPRERLDRPIGAPPPPGSPAPAPAKREQTDAASAAPVAEPVEPDNTRSIDIAAPDEVEDIAPEPEPAPENGGALTEEPGDAAPGEAEPDLGSFGPSFGGGEGDGALRREAGATAEESMDEDGAFEAAVAGGVEAAEEAEADDAEDAESSQADMTAFAPTTLARGGEMLIQIFLHPADALEQVRELARLTDAGAAARPSAAMPEAIAHGAMVELRVDAPSLEVDEPIQTLIWRGAPNVAHVIARAPADHEGGAAFVRVRALVNGVPARSAAFSVSVQPADSIEPGEEPAAIGSKAYRTAFLSYASEDRARVLEHYQTLSALGMEVFQDILDLDPGDRWEKALYTRIANSDVFLLYWSHAAAQSKWIAQEVEWAMKSQPFDPDGRPDIIPVLLEGPPPPEPPEALQHLHFNDPVRYIIAAHAAVDE